MTCPAAPHGTLRWAELETAIWKLGLAQNQHKVSYTAALVKRSCGLPPKWPAHLGIWSYGLFQVTAGRFTWLVVWCLPRRKNNWLFSLPFQFDACTFCRASTIVLCPWNFSNCPLLVITSMCWPCFVLDSIVSHSNQQNQSGDKRTDRPYLCITICISSIDEISWQMKWTKKQVLLSALWAISFPNSIGNFSIHRTARQISFETI